MKKYWIAFFLGLLAFTHTSAQNRNIDLEKLDPSVQIINASIQVIELIKEPKDVAKYMELLPNLSMFALSQVDSFDVFHHKNDTIFYTIYAQNNTYSGACEFLLTFDKGRKNLKLNPVAKKKSVPTEGIDRKKFSYTLSQKKVSLPIPTAKTKNAQWTRYILHKDFFVQPKKQAQVPVIPIKKTKSMPLIFQMNK